MTNGSMQQSLTLENHNWQYKQKYVLGKEIVVELIIICHPRSIPGWDRYNGQILLTFYMNYGGQVCQSWLLIEWDNCGPSNHNHHVNHERPSREKQHKLIHMELEFSSHKIE